MAFDLRCTFGNRNGGFVGSSSSAKNGRSLPTLPLRYFKLKHLPSGTRLAAAADAVIGESGKAIQGKPANPSLDSTQDVHARAVDANSTVLVWFKSDLRVDDHPGLELAAQASSVLPVYCFDPELYRALIRTPNGLAGLVGALQALKERLEKLGSRLLILEGKAEELIPRLADQYQAGTVITEEEVEYRWLQKVLSVGENLPTATALKLYKASLFTSEPYTDNFQQFQRQRGTPVEPFMPPQTLPKAPESAEGDIDSASGWLERWSDLVKAADRDLLSPQVRNAALNYTEGWAISGSSLVRKISQGGEPFAQDVLRQYLAASSPGLNVDSEVREAIDKTETRATPLGSFPAIFSQAVALGALSRRRVFWEAQKLIGQQTWLQQFRGGGELTARAAAITAEAADFHWHVAREDRVRDTKTGAAPRHWRWRGFMTDYFTADPEEFGAGQPEADAPAFLLVHGFGAFGEQWRGQIRALAAAGHHVYAPTLPGYGRTEKPSLPYSQYLWVSFLRDFIVEIVRRPVVVVGNSIGGFISASLAADYKQLVEGLVLFNSAGLVQKNYRPSASSNGSGDVDSGSSETTIAAFGGSGPPAFLADAVSSALLFYLQKTITRTLARVYPVNPAMADTWLSGEISRAAGDPGAQQVFRSVFYLPKPRALNYLVKDLFGGPTLILQGRKDPLQNAEKRARSMERLCPNVRVVLVEAGHCPFDECPDICNEELLSFIGTLAKTPAPPAELAAVA